MRILNIFPFILCFVLFTGKGQNKQLLYDFTEVPQSLLLNPGVKTPIKWYAGVPVLSGVSIHAGSSGISVNDIFADDGIDINTKIRDRAVFGLNSRDFFTQNTQIELVSGGFRNPRKPQDFYSFGMYIEGDFILYWPQDLAILTFEGNANQLGRSFDLGDLNTRGELLSVFHIGINKRIRKNLIVGVRGKLYSGILNYQSSRNSGSFVTNPGQNNILASTLVSDITLRTSGLQEIRSTGNDAQQTLIKRALLGGNLGLGVDLGFTYELNKQTTISGSVLDLGFIYNTQDVQTFTLRGDATVEGIEIILPGDLVNTNGDFFQELVDEIEELVPFEENDNSYISFRPTKLYGAIRYNFGEPSQNQEDCNCDYRVKDNDVYDGYLNAVGAQIFAVNRPRGPQLALTGFYQRRLGKFLNVRTTYTADSFSFTNIGLGLSFQAGPINFYIMGDNLLSYQNIADSRYASLQLGLNIISWGSKR